MPKLHFSNELAKVYLHFVPGACLNLIAGLVGQCRQMDRLKQYLRIYLPELIHSLMLLRRFSNSLATKSLCTTVTSLILFHEGKDMIAYVILACRSIVQRNNISF